MGHSNHLTTSFYSLAIPTAHSNKVKDVRMLACINKAPESPSFKLLTKEAHDLHQVWPACSHTAMIPQAYNLPLGRNPFVVLITHSLRFKVEIGEAP